MKSALVLSLAFLLAFGCRKEEADADGDGFSSYEDCDDANAAVFPGAEESCDGLDNDCDGNADNDALDATPFYADADADGYGNAHAASLACAAPDGAVEIAGDCNDSDAAFHPGAEEDCAIAEDYNCDGSVGYADLDGDGTPACEDCDDAQIADHPGALEVCDGRDNDCDGAADVGAVDATPWFTDGDSDGFGAADAGEACEAPVGAVANDEDCDDSAAAVFPGATEVCNEVDDNCNAFVDEEALDARTWYADSDGDGYAGDNFSTQACEAPAGYLAEAGDCDDLDAEMNPDTAWHPDADLDGFGASDAALITCEAPQGYTLDDQDCDDADARLTPETKWHWDSDGDTYGAELLGAVACAQPAGMVLDDRDCDDVDPSLNPTTAWYLDRDGDGYGADSTLLRACAVSGGYVRVAGDCADSDAAQHPLTVWHADLDGDGYGALAAGPTQCAEPADHLLDASDCDDLDATVNPDTAWHADLDGDGYGALAAGPTQCAQPANYVLDYRDCDDTRAEVTPLTRWYRDADGDLYGNPASSLVRCDPGLGYVLNDEDCADLDAAVSPAEAEIPGDGLDNDCAADGDTPLIVYVPERFSGILSAVHRDTGEVLWEADLGSELIDSAVGPDGAIYATLYNYAGDGTIGGVAAITPDGLGVEVITSEVGPAVHQVFYDFEADTLLVAGDGVWEVDPYSGATTALFAEVGVIGAVRQEGDPRVWYTNRSEGRLKVWDPSDESVEVVSNVAVNGNLLVPAPDRRIYTAHGGYLLSIDQVNGDVEQIAAIDAAGICEDPAVDGGLLWGNHGTSLRGWSDDLGTFTLRADLDTPWGCASNVPSDRDGDGFLARSLGGLDCDDADASVFPGAVDRIGNRLDENCDGFDGTDADGDGALSVAFGGTDCDDRDPNVFFGSEGCGNPHSCLEIRTSSPYAPSGLYAITTLSTATPLTVFCEMHTRGGGWTRLYFQDTTNYGDGQPRFFAQNQSNLNPSDPEARLYAILNHLGEFRREGAFELMMRWPDEAAFPEVMHWTQTSNPVTDAAGATPTSYAGVHIPYTDNGWSAGLQRSANTTLSLLDGTMSPLTNWYYAVGTTYCWGGEPDDCQPAPTGGADKVELLVR